MDDTFTVSQTANVLRCSAASVRRWMDTGRLRGWTTPGGHRRIPEAEVRRLREELGIDAALGEPSPADSGGPERVGA